MSSVARQEVEIKINAHHCYLLQRYFLIQILLSFYVHSFIHNFFAIVNCNFELAFFISPSFAMQKEMVKHGNGIHPWKKKQCWWTQHLKIYVCVWIIIICQPVILTTATNAIVWIKKIQARMHQNAFFVLWIFISSLHFYTTNLKTIEFAPSCDLGFCTDWLSVQFHDGCSYMRNIKMSMSSAFAITASCQA